MIVTRVRQLFRALVRRVGRIGGSEVGTSGPSVEKKNETGEDRPDDERPKGARTDRGVSSQSWRGFPRHDDSMDHEQIRTQGVGWWHGGN